MRRRVSVVAAAVSSLLLFVACGSGTDPAPIDGTMHGNITGSADPWDADKSLTASMTNGNLVIEGVEKSSITIRLTVYDAAVGTFNAMAGDPVPAAEATFGDGRTWTYSSAKPPSGNISVTITEITATTAKGTFNFLAYPIISDFAGTPTYRVTGGTFDVKIK